jgi:hypothetical protein
MAGRFIILEFEDVDAANAFAANRYMPEQCGYSVMAMFMRPKKFCDCPDKQRQNVKNWAKGKRTGLYICRVCKKPSKHHDQGILARLQYVFGFNQLEVHE